MTKVLYITHRVPYPLDKGERIRCVHILRMLSQHAQVDLLSLADEPVHPQTPSFLRQYTRNCYFVRIGRVGQYLRMLQALCSRRALTVAAFCSTHARSVTHQLINAEDYDFVLISNSALLFLLPNSLGRTRLIVDMMDVDSRKWRLYAEFRHRLCFLYRRESVLMAQVERRVFERAHAVCLTTKQELAHLPYLCDPNKAIVAGNGVDADYYCGNKLPGDALLRVVFFGALDYWPNIDAVTWFANSVWSKLVKSMPTMKFHILGRRPVRAVQRLHRIPGIIVHANVPDIRPIVSQAGIAVFPLRIVMGILNKVLEAMALARACVVSPQVHDIIAGRDRTHYLVATHAEDWYEKIARLVSFPAEANRLGRNARELVLTRFNWDRQLRPLLALFAEEEPVVLLAGNDIEKGRACLN